MIIENIPVLATIKEGASMPGLRVEIDRKPVRWLKNCVRRLLLRRENGDTVSVGS